MGLDAATAATGESTTAALLARAQQVADQLQSEARQEAERLTADLAVLREEARRLMAEAEADRAEAGRARKQAEEVLSGASDEAATIVVDANEQAALLMSSAGSARDREVEQARLEGDQLRSCLLYTSPSPRDS